MVIQVQMVQRVQLDLPVLPAQWDRLVPMELPVGPVPKVLVVLPAGTVEMVCLALLVLRVLKVFLVWLESLVLPDLQADRVIRVLRVKRVTLVSTVWLGLLVQWVPLAHQVPWVMLVRSAQLVIKVLSVPVVSLGQTGAPDFQDLKVLWVPRVLLVSLV